MRLLLKPVSGKLTLTPNLPWIAAPAPADSSQLGPIETPVWHNPCSPSVGTLDRLTRLVETFRHTGWKQRRAAIFNAMYDVGRPEARRERFARCGADRWILRSRSDPTIFKHVTAKCHDRFCSPCVVDRQAVIRRNLHSKLGPGRYRFLTLTLRHQHDPLRPLFNRLHAAFRKLRQTSLWKERVDGGVAMYELTYDAQANGWHPHLHCILQGRYMDVVVLRRIWLSITGDSTGVDLQKIRDKANAIWYVCKYSTKAMPPGIFREPDALNEALDVLSKRRLLLCFGAWRNFRLLIDPEDSAWEAFDSVQGLIVRRMNDDPVASRILSMLHTADVRTAEFVVDLHDLPPPED